jgi:hypothetical protein
MSGVIQQYKKFKANLAGYVDVPFDTFRHQLLPLAGKKVWAAEDVDLVRRWFGLGADYALSILYERNPLFKHQYPKPVAPPSMSREDLDREMRNLVKNCLRAGWSPERFAEYRAYLRSSMTVQQLAEQDKERRKKKVMTGEAKRSNDPDDDLEAEPSTEGIANDEFAIKYRNSNLAFQTIVDQHLTR